MRDVPFLAIANRFSGFGVLPVVAAAILSPGSARADAFPDTIRFDGFEACGLQCLRPNCPSNGTTSLSGTIFAPNGTLPLPNVEVYVPNASVAAFVDGPNAPRCDEAPSGHPLVATLTDANGNFLLKDVPATTNLPVVVLAGKWRRQVTVANVPACANTALDPALTRLPRDHAEGDIAHIAVVTGSADAVECLVRKTGVLDSEFSTNSGSGRIHLYSGPGGGTNKFDVANGSATFASGTTLWASSTALSAYDQVMLGCDGLPNPAGSISQTSLDAMKAYADAGGRVYFAHWQNYWVQSVAAWSVATWNNGLATPTSPMTGQVANDFFQAAIEYDWLVNTGASAPAGMLTIYQGRQTALTVQNAGRRWIYMDTTSNNQPSIQLFTFTTPVDALPGVQTGRVLFTDIHDAADGSGTSKAFPSGGCGSAVTSLSPQEKALVYATFDLQRCVGSTRE